jgi:hypothetical protein
MGQTRPYAAITASCRSLAHQRRSLRTTQIFRHLESTASSLGPGRQNPRRARSQAGSCHHLENLFGAELFLTPRPSRPADLEGEGVMLMLSPRR